MTIQTLANRCAIFLLAAMLGAPLARADTLLIGSGAGNPVPYNNVKVDRVQGGKIIFRTSTGNETSRDLSKVVQMTLDDEPAFNAAEAAYAKGDWNAATDGYQKTVRSTDKQWLADFCSIRLIDAAGKSGRFDAAVTGYIAAVLKDPAMADAKKPALPDGKSTYLDTAADELNDALASSKLEDVQRQALLSFLLEIHRARGDAQATADTTEQLLKISAAAPNSAGSDSRLAGRALADLKLGLAHVALDEKNFAKARDTIESSREVFVEPDQQADALFCLAEARAGLRAGNDPAALKASALDYMRVVAHFKDEPASAGLVANALVKTAAILEQLNERADALSLYQQVTAQYAGSSDAAADAAKAGIERIENGAAPAPGGGS